MSATVQTWDKPEAVERCRIVVLYDGPEARSRAMQLWHHLTLQFAGDIRFDFNWWRMDFLKETGFASLSAAQAGAADIVVICSSPGISLAAHVKKWFESWTRERFNHPGVLVDLTNPAAPETNGVWATKEFLREAAHKAGLDYLETSPLPANGSINPFGLGHDPVKKGGPVLEYFLSELPAPEHSGLNE